MTDIHTVVVCDVDGTLTDGHVYVDHEGRESLRFCKRDGWLLDDARKTGIKVALITDDPNPAPACGRARKLGLTIHGPIIDGTRKIKLVQAWKARGARVVFIGDSPADVEVMNEADEAYVPADGGPLAGLNKPAIRVPVPGGHGVLHDVLQRLLAKVSG